MRAGGGTASPRRFDHAGRPRLWVRLTRRDRQHTGLSTRHLLQVDDRKHANDGEMNPRRHDLDPPPVFPAGRTRPFLQDVDNSFHQAVSTSKDDPRRPWAKGTAADRSYGTTAAQTPRRRESQGPGRAPRHPAVVPSRYPWNTSGPRMSHRAGAFRRRREHSTRCHGANGDARGEPSAVLEGRATMPQQPRPRPRPSTTPTGS
jgi:hypothetical protein